MRTEHGVHVVELEQFVAGVRVLVDGAVIARRPPWSFSELPYRFAIGSADAVLTVSADTRAATIRATLFVDGARVLADVPSWRRRNTVPTPWRAILVRAAYALGLLLVAAGAAGDPFQGWIAAAVMTGVELAWFAAIRGVDPFGLVPPWASAVTWASPRSRPSRACVRGSLACAHVLA